MENDVHREVPSSLKRLARMVVRGFYNMEHVIIIDMLVRNPCMKEDDLVDLLKFDRKQLRTCIAQLKNDKFIKIRLKMETGLDGKTTRQNYYFINYKVFVNVVKYKLDHMRRKIETEERDSTSRASFKCPQCLKSFTDLEVNLLFDPLSNELRCTHCNATVEEDESSLPKQDSRLLLAKFNEQIEPMFELLHQVEDIKLAPEILEPEPTDISDIKRATTTSISFVSKAMDRQMAWSGDATRNRDHNLEQDVTINFGDEKPSLPQGLPKKERPIWMVESTVVNNASKAEVPGSKAGLSVQREEKGNLPEDQENIMQLLLTHEKKGHAATPVNPILPKANSDNESDTSESDDGSNKKHKVTSSMVAEEEEEEEEEEMDDNEAAPMVTIGNVQVSLHDVTDELISKMTPVEKEAYIALSRAMYASLYE